MRFYRRCWWRQRLPQGSLRMPPRRTNRCGAVRKTAFSCAIYLYTTIDCFAKTGSGQTSVKVEKRVAVFAGRKGTRGGPPLCHHHGLSFLGLLPGQQSHRQPIAPPPYAEGDHLSARVVSIEVLRGLQEDGYVDYEICAVHSPAAAIAAVPTDRAGRAAVTAMAASSPASSASPQAVLSPYGGGGGGGGGGSAAAGWVGSAASESPMSTGGGGGSAPASRFYTYCRFSKFERLHAMLKEDLQCGGNSAVLLPELPKKTVLTMHGGVDDVVFVEQRRGALDR
jgi:hypothetical protein